MCIAKTPRQITNPVLPHQIHEECIHVHLCMYVCMYVCMCVYVYVYAYVYVCMHVSVYLCMFAYFAVIETLDPYS